MSFGKWSGKMGRSMTATGIGVAAALALSVAGCGGGGGSPVSSSSSSPGQAEGSTATITGTVVDTPNFPNVDANAVVAFGKYYTVTGTNGTFSLSVPSGTAGQLIVYGRAVRNSSNALVLDSNTGLPTSDVYYENIGYYPGTSQVTTNEVALLSTGIPIAALNAGSTDNLGYIGLLTLNDPPPPPNI